MSPRAREILHALLGYSITRPMSMWFNRTRLSPTVRFTTPCAMVMTTW